jgi:hypothetical protein
MDIQTIIVIAAVALALIFFAIRAVRLFSGKNNNCCCESKCDCCKKT